MNSILKYTAAAALTGALAVAAATPGQARDGRNAAAAIGFGAGALVGAAAANAASDSYYAGPRYYGPGYGYSGYAYYGGPRYAVEPIDVYEPAPRYVRESYAYAPARRQQGCWKVTDDTRGFGYYGSCETPRVTPGARTPRTEAR
jgi:hypothetical protein